MTDSPPATAHRIRWLDGTRISLLKVLPEHSLVTALNPSRSRDQNPALQ